jgi:Zn-dependent M28 family amino/carboxypeptidase
MVTLAHLTALLLASGGIEVAQEAERLLTADSVRAHVRFLASDLLEGRGPGTRGDLLTQAYVASQFEQLGLRPAGAGGGYLQPFEMVGVTSHLTPLSLTRGEKTLALKPREEFIATTGDATAQARVDRVELVFVGYGIVAKEYQWDDFKGVDVKGKVLLVMNNDPESDPHLFAGKTRLWYGRWDYKFEEAAKHGALGALIIHTTPSAGYPWSVVQSSWSGQRLSLVGSTAPTLTVEGWVTEDAARRVAALVGKDLDALRARAERRDFRPVPLGVVLSTALSNQIETVRTANVLGLLPGTDPSLSHELVVYTAHHDHLGVRAGARPGEDSIYNGAVDNATGVAQLLTLARAYAAMREPPRRSVLFAAVGAEEGGLLGSEYLVHHPPAPLRDLAVDINMDGANIFGRTRDVSVLGLGKADLDQTLEPLARAQGRVLRPDLRPDRGFFYRSDQLSFARAGVPATHFSSGLQYIGRPEGWGMAQQEAYVEKRYHQPSDELTPDWDLSGAVEDVKLYFELGLCVANGEAMPKWTPGDEFEAVRKRGL